MTYKSTLPLAFHKLLRIKPERARLYVEVLLDPKRQDVPQGSSFAITVDNWDGTWNLWLSEASFDHIRSLVTIDEFTMLGIGE